MSDYIKGFKVGAEVKQYDYNSLANLPTLLELDTTLSESGKAADAKVVGERLNELTKVYDVSNSVKNTIFDNELIIDDVSPITHNLTAKVSSKNLINLEDYILRTNDSGDVYAIGLSVSNLIIGETYTLSTTTPLKWIKISTSPSGYDSVIHTDTNGFNQYTFVMTKHKSIGETNKQYIFFSTASTDILNNIVADLTELTNLNIQIEYGSAATDYTQYLNPSTTYLTYNEQTYSPNSDGSVDGLVSTYPTMEMSVPEGFKVYVEYNQDTNAVIKKLTDAIVALGGTV